MVQHVGPVGSRDLGRPVQADFQVRRRRVCVGLRREQRLQVREHVRGLCWVIGPLWVSGFIRWLLRIKRDRSELAACGGQPVPHLDGALALAPEDLGREIMPLPSVEGGDRPRAFLDGVLLPSRGGIGSVQIEVDVLPHDREGDRGRTALVGVSLMPLQDHLPGSLAVRQPGIHHIISGKARGPFVADRTRCLGFCRSDGFRAPTPRDGPPSSRWPYSLSRTSTRIA